MRNTAIVLAILLSMFLISGSAFCWEWEQVFTANAELIDIITDNGITNPDQALSKFVNYDDDVTDVKLAIIHNGICVHYHVEVNPVVNTDYYMITTHFDDLIGSEAVMVVAGGNFQPREYLVAKIVYPF